MYENLVDKHSIADFKAQTKTVKYAYESNVVNIILIMWRTQKSRDIKAFHMFMLIRGTNR